MNLPAQEATIIWLNLPPIGKNKIKDEFIAQQADGPTCLSVIS